MGQTQSTRNNTPGHRASQITGASKGLESTTSQDVSPIGSTAQEFSNANAASTPSTSILNDSNREPHSSDQSTETTGSAIPTVTITGNKLYRNLVYRAVEYIIVSLSFVSFCPQCLFHTII